MDQRRMVTLPEAAAMAGTSLDTIRRKLRKGELRQAATNKKGVFIELDSLRDAFDLSPDAGQLHSAAMQEHSTRTAAELEVAKKRSIELEGQISELRSKLAEMELAAARKEGEHLQALAAVESRAAVAEALAGERRGQVENLRELVASLSKTIAEERSKSWWRRLVG